MGSDAAVEINLSNDSREAISVTWDGPDDPQHPRNWAVTRKWRNVFLISIQATLSPMASVILAVASDAVSKDFGLTDAYTPSLPTALFVLGFGLGPLFLAPLSELYGRRIIYLSCFALFTVFNICCAVSPNLAALSVFRLFCGMAGSAGPSIGGGTIGDMFTPATRGKAQSFYSFGPTGGSAIGGVIGGFILRGTGSWRWLAWIMAMAAGVVSVLSVFFLHETFSPFLLRQKAARMRKSTGDKRYRCEFDIDTTAGASYKVVLRTVTRATMMLVTSPVCAAMSTYMALIYGILYLHMVTLPLLFSSESKYGLPSYHWSSELTGLSYLGTGLGSVVGAFLGAVFLNRTYGAMQARAEHKGIAPGTDPRRQEYRMPFMQVGALIVPAGLFIFAFTAREDVHWIAPLIGAGVFSAGMLMTYICVTTYLVDTFETYAASALAAMTVTRSVLGCVFGIIGNKLYQALGYQWGTLLLACLCVVMAPLPIVFYYMGPRLRQMGGFHNAK